MANTKEKTVTMITLIFDRYKCVKIISSTITILQTREVIFVLTIVIILIKLNYYDYTSYSISLWVCNMI